MGATSLHRRVLSNGSGKRLDWILTSSDLNFEGYEIVSEVMSDHLAVIARIGIE